MVSSRSTVTRLPRKICVEIPICMRRFYRNPNPPITGAMISNMFRVVRCVAIALFLTLTASAQTHSLVIQPDIRLFTTMAALNAAGFDIEFGSQYHPVREAVRKFAAEVDPDLIARLMAFYAARKGDQTDEAQLPKYISLAVTLSDAPAFKPLAREENMPPDARSV